jgi:hypothetical protein
VRTSVNTRDKRAAGKWQPSRKRRSQIEWGTTSLLVKACLSIGSALTVSLNRWSKSADGSFIQVKFRGLRFLVGFMLETMQSSHADGMWPVQ